MCCTEQVPVIESAWERLRSQGLDVWRSNGTLDGTLSWYSLNSYGRHNDNGKPGSADNLDPWLNPYPTPTVLPNGTAFIKDPAGWGYLLWPPPPKERTALDWAPIESIRWVMTGAGTVSLLKVQVLPSQAKDYCEHKT